MSVASDASRIALDEIIPRYWRASLSKRSSSASTSANPTIVVSGPLKSCASIAIRSFLTWFSSTTASRRDASSWYSSTLRAATAKYWPSSPIANTSAVLNAAWRCTSSTYAVPPPEPGTRTAARCSSSSSTHTSLRDASATNESPAVASSSSDRSVVAPKPPRGRGAYSVARPSTSSCTPDSSASTSTLGSSDANSVRAIDVIAVSRSFCIVSCTPRSTCSVTSRCTIT